MAKVHWPWTTADSTKTQIDTAFDHERHALERDIEQMKRVNEYLLAKALTRGWITPEAAEAIRTTQAYENEVLDLGSHPEPAD